MNMPLIAQAVRWVRALLLIGLPLAPLHALADTVTVATAATLRYAMDELSARFEKATGHTVRAVYGASGQFYSQIRQGAPFDVFMAADLEFPQKLVDDRVVPGPVIQYAEGRLVLLLPKGRSGADASTLLKADSTLGDLKAAMADGRLSRFAIANPQLAPYGLRAQETLEKAGLWQVIQPKLVLGENISQAAQFVSTGAAQGGLVALSLALAPQLAQATHYVLIDRNQHRPLQQGMVLVRSTEASRAFVAFVQTAQGKAVLRQFGYE
ncbi:molybdate ABC transporter substrate-binding protein [Limnobacter humi]|uniref:Molybdate ABC transporter substrate-binding protein n=1 Tax=Limnobacter humi TaxID=1778671 RepID=A0ABT1WGR0_9BURK|nr:molybdate ABC transporter substrate-binding protein [Limnobacter humi]MCQ8896698.1 molybdate ABC transporter substrate-binding protein [Limnobacter humi]